MTEHPLHSDKDNIIPNLERELKATYGKINLLEGEIESFKRERRIRMMNLIKKLIIVFIIAFSVSGIAYAIWLFVKNEMFLNTRCEKLCNYVLGDFSIAASETTEQSCRDRDRRCVCYTRMGDLKVTLAGTNYDELTGDLKKLAAKFDVEVWKKCMMNSNASITYQGMCNFVPWKKQWLEQKLSGQTKP